MSAYEIALGLPPAAWLEASWQYIQKRIELFSHFNITPIWVLDGRRSPLKVGWMERHIRVHFSAHTSFLYASHSLLWLPQPPN